MALANRQQDRLKIVHNVLRSQGSPLNPAVRALMEASFGRNFGRVRLHTNDLAAASARALRARAYAVGLHVVFAEGYYSPWTREGLWLLAHELTHVIQQGGKCSTRPLGVAAASDPLEREANRAADLIAAGRSLSPAFAFGSAPAGIVQRHQGPACGGYQAPRDIAAEFRAVRLLEDTYLAPILAGGDDVCFASTYPNNLTAPSQVPNPRFAADVLNAIRAWPEEERPNIIDFLDRKAYFFWAFRQDANIVRIINRFHQTVHFIGRRHNEQDWNSVNSNWFPDHVLPLPGDPLQRFVCTELTLHQPPRGLILYNILTRQRLRRPQQRSQVVVIEDFEPNYVEYGPSVRAQIRKTIRFYDPDSPDYVIIVAPEFYQLDAVKYKANKEWQQLRMKLPVFVDSNQLSTAVWHSYLIITLILVAAWSGGTVLIAADAVVAAGATMSATAVSLPATAGTTAQAGGAIEVVVAYEASGASAVTSSIVVPGTIATQVAGSSGAMVAMQALISSSAVKTAATIGAAGVVMIVGNVRAAHADVKAPTWENLILSLTTPHSPTPHLTIEDVSAIRAIPINDFQLMAGVPHAFSGKSWHDYRHEMGKPEQIKFGLGRPVFYDNKRHWILGRCKVK